MNTKLISITAASVIAYLFCVLFGLVLYGNRIFAFRANAFVVITFGLIGAIFFSIYFYGNKKEIIFAASALIISNIVFLGKPLKLVFIIRDLVFLTSLFISIILYSNFIKKYYYSPMFIRALAFSFFYGILNIISTIILSLLYSSKNIDLISAIYINSKSAIAIGLGLGIGFDLYKKYKSMIFRIVK